jgi:hypothetical protein
MDPFTNRTLDEQTKPVPHNLRLKPQVFEAYSVLVYFVPTKLFFEIFGNSHVLWEVHCNIPVYGLSLFRGDFSLLCRGLKREVVYLG